MAWVVGDGPGRGIALMIMIVGFMIALSVLWAASRPRLRALEDELPDAAAPDETVREPAASRR
jgi:hypothetical protein